MSTHQDVIRSFQERRPDKDTTDILSTASLGLSNLLGMKKFSDKLVAQAEKEITDIDPSMELGSANTMGVAEELEAVLSMPIAEEFLALQIQLNVLSETFQKKIVESAQKLDNLRLYSEVDRDQNAKQAVNLEALRHVQYMVSEIFKCEGLSHEPQTIDQIELRFDSFFSRFKGNPSYINKLNLFLDVVWEVTPDDCVEDVLGCYRELFGFE